MADMRRFTDDALPSKGVSGRCPVECVLPTIWAIRVCVRVRSPYAI
jgi:hypothetical protein